MQAIAVAVVGATGANLFASDVLSYWDFNNSTAGANLGSLNTTGTVEVYNATTMIDSPASQGVFGSNSTLNLSNLVGTNGGASTNNWGTFAGSTINAVGADTAGNSLAIVGTSNNGKFITFAMPTTGYGSIQLNYAYRSSSTGVATEDWQYSTDGTLFTDFSTLTLTRDGAFHSVAVDFTTANTALQNQPTVYLRMFAGGATGTAGTTRLDNVQMLGSLLPASFQLVWTGGNGTWDVATKNWQSAAPNDTIWNNGAIGTTTEAVFNTQNNVTIDSGGVTADGLGFANGSNGTVLSGPGAVTLSGPLVLMDAGVTATIGAQVSGIKGLNVSNGTGVGTLVLTNTANNFTGGVTVSTATLSIGNDAVLGDAGNAVTLQNATLVVTSPMTTGRTVNVASASTLDTQANNVTISSGLVGSGALTKAGTGTLTLSAAGATFPGGMSINAGKVVVNSASATGLTGAGTGAISVGDGATLSLENGVAFGLSGTGNTSAPSVTLIPGTTGGTLQASGGVTVAQGAAQSVGTSAGNVSLVAANAGDALVLGSALRNSGSVLTSLATVRVQGAGLVKLASGATSNSANTTTPTFSGTWEVAMDQGTGVLSVGPILTGGTGEVLNGLGYHAPAVSGSNLTIYAGVGNAVKVTSGTLAFGADAPNARATPANGTLSAVVSFRNPLTLNGGKIASTGFEYDASGNAVSAIPVKANLSADISTAPGTTSTVSLYDPVLGATSGGRSLNVMNDAAAVTPDGGSGTAVSSNLTWGQGATLIVDATGVTATPGALNMVRTTGTVAVGTSANLQINPGAAVNLGGSMDALSDGTNNVGVLDNGSFNVTSGAKHTGAVDGTGNTTVSDTISLTATHVIQAGLTINGSGSVVIRPGGGTNGTSKISSLTIGGGTGAWTGKLNIADNKLILEATQPTKASVMAQTQDQLASGISVGTGILTATLPAGYGLAVIDNGALSTPKVTFGGVSVDTNSILISAELLGDSNADGHVDLTDLSTVLNNFGATTSAWSSGNFDHAATIDLTDLSDVLNNFGLSNPNASSVGGAAVGAAPEPASLAMLGIGALLVGRRRRA